MNTLLQRASLAFGMAMFAALSALPSTAAAATGPWTWTDVSSQVSVRTNRPVWAMAYAGSSWFFTDGQDLTTTGHVWKTDGQNSQDITSDVLAAGLTRVDDIVSDGKSVLFLKGMTSSVNSVEAVLYTDHAVSRTSALQGSLLANEGIVSIVGKSGSWDILTTRGRLLSWDGATTATPVAFPSDIQNLINANTAFVNGAPGYVSHTNGMTPAIAPKLQIAEVGSNQLLLAFNTDTGVKFYQYDGTNFSNVTFRFPAMNSVYALDSNGTTAIALLTKVTNNVGTQELVTYDGTGVTEAALPIVIAGIVQPKMEWTGKFWMILSGKDLYRLNGNQFESYGQTRDYFTSLAGDANGHLMLGGAVSSALSMNPTNPLTAKLAEVSENGDVSAALVDTSTWTWVEPYATEIHRDQTLTYNVGAWSSQGLKHTEIYVNWNMVKACDYTSGASNSQTCTVTVAGSSFTAGSTVSMIAKITNGSGKVTWTPFTLLTVTDSPFAIAPNTNTVSTPSVVPGMSIGSWFQPNVVTLDLHDQALFVAQANAQNGLTHIDIAVNGTSKIPCDFARAMGTQSCSYTIDGSNYSVGQQLTLTATARDNNGSTTSQSHTLTITDNFANAGAHPSVMTTWMSPSQDTISNGDTVTFFANAQDIDGLAKIVIYANGNPVQTCSFTNAYDTRGCSTTITDKLYPVNSTVTMLAKAYDNAGNVTLANARGYYIAN